MWTRGQLEVRGVLASLEDARVGALIVDGQPWLVTGMYVEEGNMLTGHDVINMSQQMHNPGFGAKMERLARGGVNTVMVYGIADVGAEALRALLADFALIRVRVMFQIVQQVIPLTLPGGNTSVNWKAFTDVVNMAKDSDALLGWYICDDCTGMSARAAPSLNLTNWDTCTGLARVYAALRELDPVHVTIGAVQSTDMWSFSDGPGALSIDVSMIENYDTDLAHHATGADSALRRWPMDMSIVVNCVWMQGAWQLGVWSARQLNSVTWAGAVTAGMYHNLYFGIYVDTEEPITSAVMSSSMQLHEPGSNR